jgi:hypothetical protein
MPNNMLTKFNQFINEGVRDTNGVGLLRSKMTGKSIEDIKKVVDRMTPDEKLSHIYRYDLKKFYTDKELDDMFFKTATRISSMLMKDYDYHYEDNAYQWALSHRDDLMNLIGKGWALADVVYCVMLGSDKEDRNNTEWEDVDMNEGVRDKMTPKSKEERCDILIDKYGLDKKIVKFLNENGYEYESHYIPEFEGKGISYCFYNKEEDWRIYFHNEDTIFTIKQKMGIDEVNEGVRDKMKPKSADDVRRKHYNLIFWKLLVDGKMSDELKKITTHYSRAIEVARDLGITNEPKTPWQRELMMYLYVLNGVRSSSDELDLELWRLVNSLDKNNEQAAIYVGIKNLVNRKYVETNLKFKENMGSNIMDESVRDTNGVGLPAKVSEGLLRSKMTSKSEEDIYKALCSKYYNDIEIFNFLNNNGYRFVTVHNALFSDPLNRIRFEFYNKDNNQTIYFHTNDTIETIKNIIR